MEGLLDLPVVPVTQVTQNQVPFSAIFLQIYENQKSPKIEFGPENRHLRVSEGYRLAIILTFVIHLGPVVIFGSLFEFDGFVFTLTKSGFSS